MAMKRDTKTVSDTVHGGCLTLFRSSQHERGSVRHGGPRGLTATPLRRAGVPAIDVDKGC